MFSWFITLIQWVIHGTGKRTFRVSEFVQSYTFSVLRWCPMFEKPRPGCGRMSRQIIKTKDGLNGLLKDDTAYERTAEHRVTNPTDFLYTFHISYLESKFISGLERYCFQWCMQILPKKSFFNIKFLQGINGLNISDQCLQLMSLQCFGAVV